MSASSDTYVAFRVCQSDCFSFTCQPWLNAPPLSLYSLLLLSFALLSIHSSVVLSQINFCPSQRRPDRGNQSWPFRKKKKKKKKATTLLNQLVTFNYDKWNWINKTSNELSCSKDNRGTHPSVAGFWIALEMNGGNYNSLCVCEWECVFYVACLWGEQLSCVILLQRSQTSLCPWSL